MQTNVHLTEDAIVTPKDNGRSVITVGAVENNLYRAKPVNGQPPQFPYEERPTYFRLSIWCKSDNVKVYKLLRKSAVVNIQGVISASVYLNKDKQPDGRLQIEVRQYDILHHPRKDGMGGTVEHAPAEHVPAGVYTGDPADDLPF